MYQKVFYIVVDEDSFPFITIDLDDIGTSAKDPSQEHLLKVLSKSPTVVELKGIKPVFGTTWDGIKFEEFIEDVPNSTNPNFKIEDLEKIKKFSLVVNGKHSSIFGVNTATSNGEMIAAALSSNPTITGSLIS
jgi:hypothetical protein